jgi:hypothetical protein
MKKLILSVIGVLVIILAFSFTNSNFEKERVIKITSEKPIEFDMVQNGAIKKSIKTPYEFKFVENTGYFIFKSKKKNGQLKLSVEEKNGGSLGGNWEIVVLTIDNDKLQTFGMNSN